MLESQAYCVDDGMYVCGVSASHCAVWSVLCEW